MKSKNVLTTNYITMLLVLMSSIIPFHASADELRYKPFVLAEETTAIVPDTIAAVKKKLTKGGFVVVGEYSPYENTSVIIFSNDTLKTYAAKTDYGSFAAAMRVTITKVKDKVQISYSNPSYLANAYQLDNDLNSVSSALKSTLGFVKAFGSAEGLTKDDLRNYQYKWLMPYFADRIELMTYPDQKIALAKVDEFLKSNNVGASKVYQIDMNGKKETVIGVALQGTDDDDCSSDKYIMNYIDFAETKSTPHLPYEIVVADGTVYALAAEFRIAISFPDLSMMGSNSFASIMCAPGAISGALAKAVGGTLEDE